LGGREFSSCTGIQYHRSGNGKLTNPQGIAIDTNGNFWVSDWTNNYVQEFNNSGSFVMGIGAGYNGVSGSIGSSGSGNGQFNNANNIAIGGR
jgi:hypothetical protein